MLRSAAFFDIDGTLISCYSQKILADEMRKRGLITLGQNLRLLTWFSLYKLGLIQSSEKIRRSVYRIFEKYDMVIIKNVFSDVIDIILKNYVRSEMKEVLLKHKAVGDQIYAISGTLSDLAIPICAHFGIANCFGTTLEVKSDRYTGVWKGALLEGVQKSCAMKELAQANGLDLASSYGYADSYADLAMLETVGHPFAVYPDDRLKEVAMQRKWGIIDRA